MSAPSSRRPSEGDSPKPPPAGPASILLVDDDPRNLDVLEAVLSSPDYRFVRCQNAEEALLALVRGDFAAIVLDVQMPGTNGLELARLVKQRRRSSHIPIIFLTAHFQDEKDVLEGYGAGAVDYLTKPVNPGILRSKVSVVVNLFQTTRALTAANIALRREIEQRQQAEQSLREANAALEARVQERTADLSRTNMELRRSEERYRLILENALEYAIFTLDLEGRVTSWNSGAQRVLGFDESEMIGQRLDVIFTTEDRDHGQVDIEMGRAVTNDRAQDERWHLRKDGSPFWATGLMMPLKGEDGQPQGFLKILRDRTQRKLADEARARLAALVQSSADAIISKNLQGTILNWNAAAERLLGYRADEIIGQSIFRLCPPGRDQEERDILARIQAGESLDHFETIRQARDGRIIPVSLTVSPIRDEAGNIMGVSSIARDITRQKLAEQMLRESREELRRALEFDEAVMTNMGEGLYTVDRQGLVTSLNPAAEKLFGWSREELLGRRMHDMTHHTHPDGRPFPVEECSGLEVLRTGQALIEYEDVFIRKDGTFFDVVYSSSPLRANGEIVGLVMVFRDVSEVKRIERERTRAEERIVQLNDTLVSVMESIPDALFVTDESGQIRFRNPAAGRFSRLSGLEDRLPPPVAAELEEALQTGEHLVPTSLKTVHRFVLDREERFFFSRILCMTTVDKRSFGAAIMLQDVTELRLLDEIKTNLISTVSHELKTPLTSLRTALLVLCENALGSLNDSQKELLGIARDESERLLRTLNVLLDLTRFEEGATGMRLEKVSPEELIQAAVEELRSAAATGGVTVHAEFESSLPAIPMDRERMLHVLTNLLSNAIKYSPNGGRVIVRAQFHVDSIRVSVSDNGPGVPAQYHSRIFEKFFRVPGTPKTGAGLGLSIAREFIRAHRGQIGVQSEPGRGSEFYFLLPLD